MDWAVRQAIEEDTEAVGAVAAAGWRDTYAGLLQPATIEAFLAGPYAPANVRRRIASHVLLVAAADGPIAAFADLVVDTERVQLVALYALPERQGRGAGTALLGAIIARFPDRPIDAVVLSGNRKGEIFYERRGFMPIETIATVIFDEAVTERLWRRPLDAGV